MQRKNNKQNEIRAGRGFLNFPSDAAVLELTRYGLIQILFAEELFGK
jgi:hypothetical protein